MSDEQDRDGSTGSQGSAVEKPRRRRTPRSTTGGAIDIIDALEAPVRQKHDGGTRPVDPHEAFASAHSQGLGRSLRPIDEAPPSVRQNGVFAVSRRY